MIWELALEPSIIPLHVHTHHVKQQDDDNDNPGIPPFQTEIRWISECTESCECMFSFVSKRAYPLTLPSLLLVVEKVGLLLHRGYGVYFDQIYDSATGRPWKPPQHLEVLQMLLPDFFPIDLGLRLRQQRRLEGSDGVTQDIEISRNDKTEPKSRNF